MAAARLVLKITVTPIARNFPSADSAPGTGATCLSPVRSHSCQRGSDQGRPDDASYSKPRLSRTVSSTSNTAALGLLPHAVQLGAASDAPGARTTDIGVRCARTYPTSAFHAWMLTAAASPEA